MTTSNPTPNDLRTIAKNMLVEGESSRAEIIDAVADELERNREVLKDYAKMPPRIASLEAQNKKLVEALKGMLMAASFWKGTDGWDETDDETYEIARALLAEVTK